MDFKYRWKNGAPPSRDQAMRDGNLLDESQFESAADQELAEETARRHLNLPIPTADANTPLLPRAMPKEQADIIKP